MVGRRGAGDNLCGRLERRAARVGSVCLGCRGCQVVGGVQWHVEGFVLVGGAGSCTSGVLAAVQLTEGDRSGLGGRFVG